MNFKEYKNLDYAQVADEILQFWQEQKVFEKSVEIREGQPTFTFYEVLHRPMVHLVFTT
jgi:isoleucyl-tRNA synthetase